MRTNLALGALLVATTASVTVTVTGLAGLTGIPGTERLAPPAAAVELVPFEDCDDLLQWYVDEALPEVGPYGLSDWPMAMPTASIAGSEMGTRVQGLARDASAPVENSGTGTNVQEAGVDEPDRAKTDGRVVVHVRGNDLVVTDVTGPEAREVGTVGLPRDLGDADLLLSGDTVTVIGPEQVRGGWGGPMPIDGLSRIMPFYPVVERSRLLEVSITDPATPRIVSDQSFGGALLSARQYDGTVRVVLSTTEPLVDFVQPNRGRTRKEAAEENRQILRDSTIDDWLPTVSTGDGPAEPLVDCADVRHPATGAGYGTLTVVTLDATEPTSRDTLGVTTSGQTVYS